MNEFGEAVQAQNDVKIRASNSNSECCVRMSKSQMSEMSKCEWLHRFFFAATVEEMYGGARLLESVARNKNMYQ